jgi:hypothetical protein
MPFVTIKNKQEKIIGLYTVQKKHKKHKPKDIYMKLLHKFYVKFYALKLKCDKLNLLSEYSEKKVNIGSLSLSTMRKKFDRTKNKRHDINHKQCFCCINKSEIRHHIISLVNGGNNTSRNIVCLCSECHSEIHEWLKIVPVDYLTTEFKNIV